MFRKAFAAALAAALLAGNLPARASDALGHDLAADSAELHSGTILADGTFWSDSRSDLRQEFYVSYTPSERVTPVVTYGEASRALTTVTAAARELESRGLRVVAGINGDYYDTQYGLPIGSTMTEGALRNVSSDPYYAVGFRADGTAVIGDPQLSIRTLVNGGSGFPVYAFNYLRLSDYGIFLYDHNFNARHTTGTSEAGVDVVCSVADGALTIGGTLSLIVDEVLAEASDTAVPEGKYVLTANSRATGYTGALLTLEPGDELTLIVSSGAENAEDWNEVANMLGAPVLLLRDGAVVSGLDTGSAPRTAIGQRPDGSLVFYAIDGRKSGYSVGATLTAVGMRLAELGCVTAVALDGGGSTTIAATMPDAPEARVVNTPSDGYERAVSNHVFLVAPNEPSGRLDHIWLSASTDRALPGATVTLRAAAVDTNYIPMDAAVTLRADRGTIGNARTLTLPDEPGAVTVTASYGGKRAETTVEAVEPESIVVRRGGSAVTSLTISPDSEVALTAQGFFNHLALAGDSDCFTWAYEGDGVTLTDAHTLRAGKDAATGTLTVGVGERRVEIPVTVAALPIKLLRDFEDAFEPLTDVIEQSAGTDESPDGDEAPPEAQPRLTLSRATDGAHVKFGRASGRLAYRLDGDAAATLPLSFYTTDDYNEVDCWVWGDGTVSLAIETDAGLTEALTPAEGWQALSFLLPSGARRITGMTLAAGEEAAGTIWLDQLILNPGKTDDAAPEVALSLDAEENALTGRAFDAVNGTSFTALRLTFDGAPLEHSFDKRTGSLTASLPEPDGFAHRVTLTACDVAGHLARATVELSAERADAAFPDTAEHWANGYISYLKRAGLSNGSGDGAYHPDDNISRQEFAVMLWRLLDDGADYSDTELPFADADRIGAWAADAVRAMVALGVVNGSADGEGRLWFNPTAGISRQEAAAMIGRTLEKGWPAAELTFLDSADVPVWAAEHIRTLSALGILNGYDDGCFHPAAPLTRAQIAAVLYRMN